MFGRATITLGIGPHSSCSIICGLSPISGGLVACRPPARALPLDPNAFFHPRLVDEQPFANIGSAAEDGCSA